MEKLMELTKKLQSLNPKDYTSLEQLFLERDKLKNEIVSQCCVILQEYEVDEELKDCLGCGNSMVMENDELYCVLLKKTIEGDNVCNDYN